jgi:broad specificity phosphatase PhoE
LALYFPGRSRSSGRNISYNSVRAAVAFYVVFIRHPKSNPDQADTYPPRLDNINAQRHLSDEGHKQAKALGEAFRALKLPIERVITSK